MGSIETFTLKKADIEKFMSARYSTHNLCLDNRHALTELSAHHSGIERVIANLCQYFTPALPSGNTTLMDLIVHEALLEFEDKIKSESLDIAYQAFCKAVLKSLPRVMEYRVFIESSSRRVNDNEEYWDCTREGLHTWLEANCVTKLLVEQVPFLTSLNNNDIAMMLAPKIFNRQDMLYLGLPPTGFFQLKGFDPVLA
ncbi:hypothetical protein [Alteromonas gilva]|uniref:Uncharacterized protein n=1 Tax=Alteromonas gilva TaxID=2987522 RepID=A0ABT5L8P8_9ALTE|nr:hypothetical protein [Alteromonas gilva]MDC8832851.1 hypothetical protein [Alteromonas gilva]